MANKFFRYDSMLGTTYHQRMRLIEDLTRIYGNLTQFIAQSEGVLRTSAHLGDEYTNLRRAVLSRNLFCKITVQLDFYHEQGLFHGDLHPKNIMTNGKDVVIIDWEPCSQQIIHGLARMKGTYPYIHPIDLDSRTFTALTDYLCLVRLWTNQRLDTCLSVLDQWKMFEESPNAQKLAEYLYRNHILARENVCSPNRTSIF